VASSNVDRCPRLVGFEDEFVYSVSQFTWEIEKPKRFIKETLKTFRVCWKGRSGLFGCFLFAVHGRLLPCSK
jgi:hypothetical protein